MKQVIAATLFATAFAAGLSAQAPAPAQPPYTPPAQPTMQTSKDASKDAAKSVTVTGCLKAGDSADTFILSNLKWSDKDKASEAVGTAGSAAVPAAVKSATTLKIIPSASTKLTPHVGHTIEVTGTVSEKDKTDSSAPTTPPADAASPRPSASSGPALDVRTMKMVSATCTPE